MTEQQLAAVKQALEALELGCPTFGPLVRTGIDDKRDAAITALQAIISQHALDKMAEDSREIGLTMDGWDKIVCVNHDCDECKAREQQPADEPVAWAMQEEDGQVYDCICNEEHEKHEGRYTVPLYTRPQQALSQPNAYCKYGNEPSSCTSSPMDCQCAIDAAHTQPADEPVAKAWDEGYRAGVNDERMSEANIGVAGFGMKIEPARNNPYRPQPAAREPLTDDMVTRAARELCKIHAGECQVDEQDTWKFYSDQFKRDAKAMLEAAHGITKGNT